MKNPNQAPDNSYNLSQKLLALTASGAILSGCAYSPEQLELRNIIEEQGIAVHIDEVVTDIPIITLDPALRENLLGGGKSSSPDAGDMFIEVLPDDFSLVSGRSTIVLPGARVIPGSSDSRGEPVWEHNIGHDINGESITDFTVRLGMNQEMPNGSVTLRMYEGDNVMLSVTNPDIISDLEMYISIDELPEN